MPEQQRQPFRRRQRDGSKGFFFLGGLLSAMFLGLAFPPFDHRLVVWFALIPLLVSLQRHRNLLAGRLFHGLCFALFLVFWLLCPLFRARYGEGLAEAVPWAMWSAAVDAGGTWAVLIASWCLFCGLSAVLCRRRNPVLPLLGLPVLWSGIEYLRLECLPYDFPYLTLGSALDPASPEAQSASLFGVVGLSFAICLVNAAFFLVLRETSWRWQLALAGLGCVVFLACLVYGLPREPARPGTGELRAAVVQAASSQNPTDEGESPLRIALSLRESSPDLLLLPGESFSGWPPEEPAIRDKLRELSDGRTDIVVGVRTRSEDAAERDANATPEDNAANSRPCGTSSMVLLGRNGEIHGQSDGNARLWFGAGGPRGPEPSPLRAASGTLGICVGADLYRPATARRLVAGGAQLLLSGAGDPRSWGKEIALFHHRLSALRAVENRRWLLRATQGGVSAVVSPCGEVVAQAPPGIEWGTVEAVELRDDFTAFSAWGWTLAPFSLAASGLVALAGLLEATASRRAIRGKKGER